MIFIPPRFFFVSTVLKELKIKKNAWHLFETKECVCVCVLIHLFLEVVCE